MSVTEAHRIVLPYRWKPRSYQLPAWLALERGVHGLKDGKKLASLVWHRRAGNVGIGRA